MAPHYCRFPCYPKIQGSRGFCFSPLSAMEDFPNDLLALRPFKTIYRVGGHAFANGLDNRNNVHPDFKRVLYPAEYRYNFIPPVNPFAIYEPVLQSLNYLCIDKIVEHDDLLVKLLPYLPANFYCNLMGIAEYYEEYSNNPRVLMFNWPFRRFTAMDVISYHIERSMGDVFNLGYCFVNFMRYFFESLQKNRTKHLRILDMRGMPIDDEFMGKFVRDIFYLSRDQRVPFGYHIILDCAIGKSQDTIKELTSLIRKQQKTSKKRIHLHINKLDVHYSNSDRVEELLKHIDRKELVGLSVNVGSSTWPVLKRFTKLVALKIIGKICPLHHYPNLRRLSLESSNFSDALLDPVTEKLEFLELHHRRPSDVMEEADLRHLSSLRFTNLRELNISGQQITVDNFEMWYGFLRSLAPTLQSVQAESCVDDEDLLRIFLYVLSSLVNLRYLNLSGNAFTLGIVIEDMRKFISLPKLECIEIPNFDDESFKENLPGDSNGLSGRDRFEFEFKNKSCPTLILWSDD